MTAIGDFGVGDRVSVHPACDLWMRGVRYGTVLRVGRKYVHVRDDYGRTHLFQPRNLAVEIASG